MTSSRERAALVGLIVRRAKKLDAEHSIDELAGLADAAGATVVLKMIQERPTPDPATFIGSGKLDELASECVRVGADVVIFDNELTPAQLRHIEERVGRKVVDRTQLILDIFARRARTREGKWQVELAQLKYLLPRLVGSGTALSMFGSVLGEQGADVIRIEAPTSGDELRHRAPFADEHSLTWAVAARSSRSVTCDLTHPAGLSLAVRLLERSTIIGECLGPGRLDALGLQLVELAADLVGRAIERIRLRAVRSIRVGKDMRAGLGARAA